MGVSQDQGCVDVLIPFQCQCPPGEIPFLVVAWANGRLSPHVSGVCLTRRAPKRLSMLHSAPPDPVSLSDPVDISRPSFADTKILSHSVVAP